MTTYRTAGPWGPGKGANLSPSEVDGNFYDLDTRLSNVETNPPQPNNLASITPVGTSLNFNLQDGTVIGPVPVPILQYRWRGDWQPNTAYSLLDVFRVATVGLYSVLIAHTSAATFDEAATDGSGNPLYFKMFGFSGASGVLLADLVDVAVLGLADGDMLVYDAVAGKWANETPAVVTATLPAVIGDTGAGGVKGLVPAPAAGDAAAGKVLGAGGTWVVPPGGSGSVSLSGLSDVAIVSPGNGYLLQFQSSDGKWHSVAPSSFGGTVTQVSTGSGLTGGPITSTGTVSLAAVPTGTLLANITGSSNAPAAITLSALLDSAIGSTRGYILRRDGTGWSALAPGTAGQYLMTGGAGADVSWNSPAGSGTVTSVATGVGLTGGPITGTGTVSLDAVADGDLLANTSGATSAPVPTTVSALLDHVLGAAQGEILYRGASGWAALSPGNKGYYLQTQGGGASPTWAPVKTNSGGGSGGTSTSTTSWMQACQYATTAALSATYSNGSSGVGATLTASANGAIAIDGASPALNDRILVKDQTTLSQNGSYYVSTVGDAGTAWVLTRTTDYDTSAEVVQGTAFLVLAGNVNAGTAWVMIDGGTLTIGSSAIEFEPVAGTLPDCGGGQILANPQSYAAPPIPTSLVAGSGISITSSGSASSITISATGGAGAATVTKTADYTVTTADSDTHFNNIGAGGAVTFTLPAAAAGLRYGFLVAAAQTVEILAAGSDRIAYGTTNSAAGGNLQSSSPFSFVTIEAHGAGQWIASSTLGAWTVT